MFVLKLDHYITEDPLLDGTLNFIRGKTLGTKVFRQLVATQSEALSEINAASSNVTTNSAQGTLTHVMNNIANGRH